MKKIWHNVPHRFSEYIPISIMSFQEMSQITNKGIALLVYTPLKDLEEGIEYLSSARSQQLRKLNP